MDNAILKGLRYFQWITVYLQNGLRHCISRVPRWGGHSASIDRLPTTKREDTVRETGYGRKWLASAYFATRWNEGRYYGKKECGRQRLKNEEILVDKKLKSACKEFCMNWDGKRSETKINKGKSESVCYYQYDGVYNTGETGRSWIFRRGELQRGAARSSHFT